MIELIKQLSIFPAPAVWKTIEYVSTSIWKISDRLFLLIDDSIEIHFLFPIMINNKTILSLIPFTMVITLSMNKAYSHSFSVIIIIDCKGIEFHTSEFYSIIKKKIFVSNQNKTKNMIFYRANVVYKLLIRKLVGRNLNWMNLNDIQIIHDYHHKR